jgi:DNA topoisomerase I
MLKLGRKENGDKYSSEELTAIPVEDVKKMIEAQVPGAFAKKTSAKKTDKKPAAKKGTAKKTASKKSAPKKSGGSKKA